MKRIGIDIGGTFTDIVILDDTTGKLECKKVLSTPRDPSRAVATFFDNEMPDLANVTWLVHGTTVATNAVIERRGARLGLITTQGQRDRLDIQRTNLLRLYDIFYQKPEPLIPKYLRKEVGERIMADGSILSPLSEAEILAASEELVRQGVEGICVCFLNSYVNPAHELQAKEIIQRRWPEIYVTTSFETHAEVLEYERFSTTVVNAFLTPIMDKYLRRMEQYLEQKGLAPQRFVVMQGNGGVASSKAARRLAAATVESGPAGGVSGSQYIGDLIGERDLITFDMGGTSSDVCLVRDGFPSMTAEYKIAGHPMKIPLVDIYSVGAGGGSIAWIDEGGGLHVGPLSAGSDPGPACYGLGGDQPTVSDAHTVLGRLIPEFPLGGRLTLRKDLAEKAIGKIASYYKMGVVEAASGIIRIVNENMANAIRVVTVEKGVDPRFFSLFAFGGAGPMHAAMLAKILGIRKVILPPLPGANSAFGLIASNIRHDFMRSIVKPTKLVNIDEVREIFSVLRTKAEEILGEEGVAKKDMIMQPACDMRYIGQAYVPVSVPFSDTGAGQQQLLETEKTFHRVHRELYKHAAEGEPTEIISLRLSAAGKVKKPGLAVKAKNTKTPQPGRRKVFFEDVGDFVECNIYHREELPEGFSFKGPALMHQMDATTVIYGGQTATVDKFGNVIIEQEV